MQSTRGPFWLVLLMAYACTAVPRELPRSRALDPSSTFPELVADAGSERADAGANPGSESASEGHERRFLFVATHPDDDLLLMSADLWDAIASGAPVQTVFLTAGNAGLPCFGYGAGREDGLRAAYAEMAGVANVWREEIETYEGHSVRKLRLAAARIELSFLGLADEPSHDLQGLWEGTLPATETWRFDERRPVERYTRDDLTRVLRASIAAFRPTRIGFNDASDLRLRTWPFDHADHVHAGKFVLSALEEYDGAPEQRMYRAYNIQFEPENLPPQIAARAWDIFTLYAARDAKMCTQAALTTICGAKTTCDPLATFYLPLRGRQYYVSMVRGIGTLAAPSNACVAVSNKTVVAGECSKATVWSLSARDEVKDPISGWCLSAGIRADVPITLAPCSGLSAQRFRLTSEGQLRGPHASCVTLRGQAFVLAECRDQNEQRGFALRD